MTLPSSLPLSPPCFMPFLIFKAGIGLSHKTLSNQILFSNLKFWLPSGGKSYLGGGSSRAWGRGGEENSVASKCLVS